MSRPEPEIVHTPLLSESLPVMGGDPMSRPVQPGVDVPHGTLVWFDPKLPIVATLAATTSMPATVLPYVKDARPVASVTALPVTPAFGPAMTLKPTVAFGTTAPPPSWRSAVSVTWPPTGCPEEAGPSVSVAVSDPGDPIGRHWIASFWPQKPRSIPPVSRTWVLSTRVVATPPIVIVTVGVTVTGVQMLPG